MRKLFYIAAIMAGSFSVSAQPLAPAAPFGFQQAAPAAPATPTPQKPQASTPAAAAGTAPAQVQSAPAKQSETPAEKFAIVKVKTSEVSNGIISTAADISEIKNEPRLRSYDLSKVNLEGRAISTQTTGGSQLGISWTQVARTDAKDRKEVLPKPWQSRVGTKDGTLPAGTSVTARGDMDELVTAIGKLFAAKEKEDALKEEQRKTAQSNQNNAGLGAPISAASRSNDMAQLAPLPQTVTKTEEKPDTWGTTTEGCPIRVDEAQGLAIQQNQVTKNGQSQGNCQDGGAQYPIVKSYTPCTDLVDMSAKKANPQFKRYYVDADGTTRYLDAECKPEVETVFNLTEDLASCGFQVNPQTLEVTKLMRLFYNDKNANRVEPPPAGCQPSEKVAPFQASRDVALCSDRHDLTANTTYEQWKIKFTYDGKDETYGPCTDTSKSWAHFQDYSQCPPVIDYDKNKVWKASRTAYNRDGEVKYVTSSCGFAQGDSADLQLTGSGCESTFVDNYPSNVSYGTKRMYYDFGNGPKFVSDCNIDQAQSFPQQKRTVGWENNDTMLSAKAKTEIYIIVSGSENIRSAATVREGTPDTAYTLINNTVEVDPTKPFIYEACNKFTPTLNYSNYKRPDTTTFKKSTGTGQAQGPVNVCSNNLVDNRSIHIQTSFSDSSQVEPDEFGLVRLNFTTYTYGSVNKYQSTNTETGQSVGATCVIVGTTGNTVTGSQYYGNPMSPSWTSYYNGYNGSNNLPSCPF